MGIKREIENINRQTKLIREVREELAENFKKKDKLLKTAVGYIDSEKLIRRSHHHANIRVIRIYDKNPMILKAKRYKVTIEEIGRD